MKKPIFKQLKNIIAALMLIMVGTAAYAAQGAGNIAKNIMAPVSLLSDFVVTSCFVIGGLFIFASIVKYFEHRRSPLMVTLGTVVFLFFAGVVLVAIPLIAYLSESSIHYSLSTKR